MKTTSIMLALTAALVAQTALVRVLAGDQAPVDLVLVVVVFAALSRGPVVGLWTGTFAGLLQDVLSGGIIGVSGLAKSIAGVLVGITGSHFIIATVWHRLAVLVAATVLHTFCFLGVYVLVGTATPPATVTYVLTQAVTNGVVGIAAAALVRGGPGALRRVRQGRSPLGRRHWIMG